MDREKRFTCARHAFQRNCCLAICKTGKDQTQIGVESGEPARGDQFVEWTGLDGNRRAFSERRFAREWKRSQLSVLMQTGPHLVDNYHDHEQQIDSKRPHHELLKPA